MEAQLESLRRELEELRLATERQKPHHHALCWRAHEEQMATLQSRLEALHSAQLLTDDEMFTMEDLVADSVEEWEEDIEEDGGSRIASEKVSRLVKLSGVMASDAAFARQLKRKILQ